MRTWMLAISIILGAMFYFVFVWFSDLAPYEEPVLMCVKTIQPVFIFAMLFITFCKVDPRELQLCRWHVSNLLFQTLTFLVLACPIIVWPDATREVKPIFEAAMLCLICPTATAAAVVTGKLGGNMASLTTYTILINLVVAIIVPAAVPFVMGDAALGFWTSFALIISKVFPLLICPFLLAVILRRFAPKVVHAVTSIRDLAFYLWAISLSLAIMVSVKSLYESDAAGFVLGGIALASFVTCYLQFYLGRRFGRRHDSTITAGQALGQKNTVFLIWCAYTFFDPVSSLAGGFYSIWHNLWNSYQLAQKAKAES